MIYITYVLFCLSIFIWSIFYFLWQLAKDASSALILCRALMLGAIFIPTLYLHHLITLFDLITRRRAIILFAYIFSFISLGIDFSPNFIKGVSPKVGFLFWPNPGPLFHIFLFFWMCIVLYGVCLIIRQFFNSSGIKRNQVKYLLLATLIGWGGGLTNYLLWYDIPIHPIGNFLVSGYIIITTYAIIRYRLMDINLVISRATVLIAVSIVTLIIPLLVGYYLLGWGQWVIPLFIGMILDVVSPSFYIYFQNQVEKRLR